MRDLYELNINGYKIYVYFIFTVSRFLFVIRFCNGISYSIQYRSIINKSIVGFSMFGFLLLKRF